MRNPIFSADTLFLDRDNDGTINYVSGAATRALSCGGKLVRLETRQPLVELLTESGNRLVLAPEALFSLWQEDGALVRWLPVDTYFTAQDAKLSFDQGPDDNYDLMCFMLAGMTCAAGRHSFEMNRPSSIVFPAADADSAIAYLTGMGNRLVSTKALRQFPRITPVVNEDDTVFIKTRALTTMVGSRLQDKTQVPNFPLMEESLDKVWAFLYGILRAAKREGDDLVFRHRYARVVEAVHEALWRRFGVPATLSINPMEATVTRSTAGTMPHHLRLNSEHRAAAVLAGLDALPSDVEPKLRTVDRIIRVTPLAEKTAGVIVLPGKERRFGLTANTYCFDPLFSLPQEVVDVATHPAMVDSSDPASFEEGP